MADTDKPKKKAGQQVDTESGQAMSAWWSPQLAVGCLVGVLVLALVFVGGGGAAGVATTLVEAVDPGHLLNHLVYDIILVPVITLLTRRLFPRVHAAPMHRHHPHGD